VSIVFHIGLFKTASTALQRQFFPGLPDTRLLTMRGSGDENKRFGDLAVNLCRADDAKYRGAEFADFVADMRQRSGTLLLSHEPFCGAVFQEMSNQERNLARLAALAPDARILLVLRRQDAMIRSLYSHYVLKGGYADFRTFVGGAAVGCRFDPSRLQYDTLVHGYQEAFGSSAVKVLPYELLLRDPDTFLGEITRFVTGGELSVSTTELRTHNRGISAPSRWLLRHTNQWFLRTRYNPRPRLVSVRAARAMRSLLQERVDPTLFRRRGTKMSRADEQFLHDLLPSFVAANTDVATRTGLDLRAFGYPYALGNQNANESTTVTATRGN
jgi:sulfotransferase family protein